MEIVRRFLGKKKVGMIGKKLGIIEDGDEMERKNEKKNRNEAKAGKTGFK